MKITMNPKKMMFGCLLPLAGAVLLSSCGTSLSADSPLTIWAASSVDKIMRDDSSVDTSQKSIDIQMAKNEYEGAQLMLRSSTDIGAYNVEASDLVSGTHVISSDNIAIYNTKYISSVGISSTLNTAALPVGSSMPDALLPFDVAVAYGENVLPKDVNQSIYLEVYAAKTVAAGLYKGKITVTAAGIAHYVPLQVEVIDYTIPDEGHTANYFAMWGTEHYNSAELDCTDELTTAYYEAMLDLRMSSSLPFEGIGGPSQYVELLRKYYHHRGFSSYKFFYEATYSSYDGTLTPFNVPLAQEYLTAVVKASLEDRTNYLDKAFFYFSTYIDEPDTNPSVTWEMVQGICHTYKKVLTDLAESLAASLASEANYDFYVSTVRSTLENIPDVLPGGYSIATIEKHNCSDITACISIDKYDSVEARSAYQRDDFQTWWYTCISPKYPYPNFLANNFLTAPRLISWMQKAYDIDAFLLWDVNNYTSGDNESSPYLDCYSSLTDTMSSCSDGKIFYPGKPYGITGPVSSLRAVSYRDGMEDYEILQGIYDIYEEEGMDAENALSEIYNKVFSGVITTTSAGDFNQARSSIFSLLVQLNSPTAIIYSSAAADEGDPNLTHLSFKTVNSSAVVSINGQTAAPDPVSGLYSFDLNATQTGEATIEVSIGSQKTTYHRYSSDKYTLLSDFEASSSSYITVDNFATMAVSTAYAKSGSSSLAITLNGRDKTGYQPSFAISATAFDDFATLSSLSASVYVPFDVEDDFHTSVTASYGEGVIYNVSLGSIYLAKGWNTLSLSIQESVSSLASVREIRFYLPNILDGEGNPGSETIYLDDVGYRTALSHGSTGETTDKGTIATATSDEVVPQGTETNLSDSAVVSNVKETINGENYLLLGDFENYRQAAQVKYANYFGKISLDDGQDHVTHGDQALKMEIVGRGESLKHLDPTMIFSTNSEYFQKINYSDVDYLEADFYNAMDYDVNVRFSNDTSYFSKYTTVLSFTLEPGANHLQINLSDFTKVSPTFTELCFFFERGEFFEENRIVYLDNFRAHLAD